MSESKTVTVEYNNTRNIMCVPCMICGETIELSEFETEMVNWGHHIDPKICDKCKVAVLTVRRH